MRIQTLEGLARELDLCASANMSRRCWGLSTELRGYTEVFSIMDPGLFGPVYLDLLELEEVFALGASAQEKKEEIEDLIEGNSVVEEELEEALARISALESEVSRLCEREDELEKHVELLRDSMIGVSR